MTNTTYAEYLEKVTKIHEAAAKLKDCDLSKKDKRELLHHAKYEMDEEYYLQYKKDLEAGLPLKRIHVFGDRTYERIQENNDYSDEFMCKYYDVAYD